VAVRLVFVAVAHQRDRAAFRQHLQQPQRELLAVVLDVAVLAVDAAALVQLLLVRARELVQLIRSDLIASNSFSLGPRFAIQMS
jgi:hypothetical protein